MARTFIRPGTLKGRRLLMLAYLAKAAFGKAVVLTNLTLDLSEPRAGRTGGECAAAAR
jgi:hypothetical protein